MRSLDRFAVGLPDTQAITPKLVYAGNDYEIYEGDTAIEFDGMMFPAYTSLAQWLVKSRQAKRVFAGGCEVCGDDAKYDWEGHIVCGVYCLAEVIEEHGYAEQIVAEVGI